MMAEFTVSYSIEGASGGYLTIARDRVRGERMPTATMKDRDGQPVTLYSWL
jgi:hypothetical protein